MTCAMCLGSGKVHDSENCELDDEGRCWLVHWDEILDEPKRERECPSCHGTGLIPLSAPKPEREGEG